jgi:hypothetical protein
MKSPVERDRRAMRDSAGRKALGHKLSLLAEALIKIIM